MRRTVVWIVMALVGFSTVNAFAQSKYERKSISYVDAVYLATDQAKKLTSTQAKTLIDDIQKAIEMERFDYNPLPEEMLRFFKEAAVAKGDLSVDEISELLQAYLAPEIIKVLEATMELRAGALVTEAQKQSFLATKAKELGYTDVEIDRILNSAYVYMPILSKIEEKKDEKDKYTTTLEGGIIWFQIVVKDETPNVVLRVKKTTKSLGFGSQEFAFASASKNFARNLKVATQEMPEFILSAVVAEVEGKNISFSLGMKEGLRKDHIYYVGEWMEDAQGKLSFKRDGWAFVDKVANNRQNPNARSSAWAVKQGMWSPGMSMIEHPRLGIDIALKPGVFYTEITKGSIPVLTGYLNITEDFQSYAPGFDLDAQYNLAALTGTSQFFFLVGGNFVFPAKLEMESDIFTQMTGYPPFIYGFHGGFHKKLYFGQMIFMAEAKGGIRFLKFEQKFYYLGTEYTYTVKNNTVGGQVNLGLEYACSPDVHFGVFGGYRLFPVSEVWTQELSPSEVDALVDWNEDYPDLNHSGITAGIYLNYSPPALPFDPIAMFQGMAGK